MHRLLRDKGLVCSVRRVNRLMREMGVKARTTGLYSWNPGRHLFYSGTGNQLANASDPEGPGQQWAGDFTYLKVGNVFLYYAVVLDLYSRRLVGWSFSRSRNSELTKSALRMALVNHPPRSGCLFHSDQGVEYAAHDFRELVESAGMVRSMSRKGHPGDNAKVESFFHSLKSEVVHGRSFKNEFELVAQIIEYIAFYNESRIHSSLGYQSPVNYEKLCA